MFLQVMFILGAGVPALAAVGVANEILKARVDSETWSEFAWYEKLLLCTGFVHAVVHAATGTALVVALFQSIDGATGAWLSWPNTWAATIGWDGTKWSYFALAAEIAILVIAVLARLAFLWMHEPRRATAR